MTCNCEAIRAALGASPPWALIDGHEPDCVATNEHFENVARAQLDLERTKSPRVDAEPADVAALDRLADDVRNRR